MTGECTLDQKMRHIMGDCLNRPDYEPGMPSLDRSSSACWSVSSRTSCASCFRQDNMHHGTLRHAIGHRPDPRVGLHLQPTPSSGTALAAG